MKKNFYRIFKYSGLIILPCLFTSLIYYSTMKLLFRCLSENYFAGPVASMRQIISFILVGDFFYIFLWYGSGVLLGFLSAVFWNSKYFWLISTLVMFIIFIAFVAYFDNLENFYSLFKWWAGGDDELNGLKR